MARSTRRDEGARRATARLAAARRVGGAALGLALAIGCTSSKKSGDEDDDEARKPLVSQAHIGGATTFGPREEETSVVAYEPGAGSEIAVWKSRIVLPAGAYDAAATLTLALVPSTITQTPELMLVSPLLSFRALDAAGAQIARSVLRKSMRVETIVDRIVDESQSVSLMVLDDGSTSETSYMIVPDDLTFTPQEDGSSIISFETRDTGYAFAVAVSKGGEPRNGFAKYPAVPKDNTALLAEAPTTGDLASTFKLSWTPAEGSRTGYRLARSGVPIETLGCLGGEAIPAASITELRQNFPKVWRDSYLVEELDAGAMVYVQLCSTNDRDPPDVSPGATASFQLPERALAVLSGTPTDPSRATDLDVTVGGEDVVEYSYAVIPATGSCAAATYSDWIAVAEPIQDGVTERRNLLCVLGRKSERNVQLVATEHVWTADFTPPGAFAIASITTPTNDTTPTFTWSASTDAATYTAKVGSNAACSTVVRSDVLTVTTYTPNALAEGVYYLCVSAVDAAGNLTSATNSGVTFTIDTTPPVFTSLDLANAAVGGYVNASERAVATALATNLVASGHTTATYAVAASAAACTGISTYGAMPTTTSAAMTADGAYKVCVKLDDAAANTSYGASSAFSLDTSLPSFTSLALGASVVDGYLSAADSVAAGDLAASLVATGSDSATYVVVATATTCDGSLTYGALPKGDDAAMTGDGDYKTCVKVSDLAGNPDDFGETVGFTVDRSVPSFTSIDLANEAADGWLNAADLLATNAVVDNLVGADYDVAEYQVVTAGTTCSTATGYVAPVPTGDDGGFSANVAYKICVKLSDAAGNPPAYGSSSNVTRDNVAPVFTSLDLAGDAADAFLNLAETASSTALAGSLAASGYSTATYKAAATAATCDDSLTYGVMPGSDTADLGGDGDYKVCVYLADLAGNGTYGESGSFTLDKTPPTFTSLDPGTDLADGYLNISERTSTADLAVDLVASGQDSESYQLLADAAACSSGSAYGAMPTSDSSDFGSDGDYKVCVELADAAGNLTYGAATTFTLDTTAPSFTSLALANDAVDGYLNAAEHALSADLASMLVASGYTTDAYDLETAVSACAAASGYGAMPKGDSADFGVDDTYQVCVKLTDAAGNVTYAASAPLVLDTDAPVLTSLDLANAALDGYVNLAERSSALALVSLSATGHSAATYALEADGTTCDGLLTYGAVPAGDSGDFGLDGNYLVCVRLTDAAGNLAFGGSAAFELDATVPVFTSLDLAGDVLDGYLNADERSSTSDLATNLVASGHSAVTYKVLPNATGCAAGTGYGVALPKSNSGDIGSEGLYKVCAKLVDPAGNATYGPTATFTLDVTAPVFTSLALANEAADGYLNTAERLLTNDLAATLTASGYATDAYDLVTLATACSAAPGYGAMPKDDDAGFGSDGSYRVCVELADAAGNVTRGSSATITLDTGDPVLTSITRANAASDGYVNSSERSSALALATLVASDYSSATYALVASAATCDALLTYGAMPAGDSSDFGADGSYKVCVRLADDAGNLVFGGTLAFDLDATVPVFTSLARAGDAADGYVNLAERASTSDLADTLVASGQTATGYKLLADASACSGAGGYGTMPTADSSDFGANGAYKVCVRLTDDAGNATYGSTTAFDLDVTAPTFTSLALANDAVDGYLTLAESASTSALGGALTASGYTADVYDLVANATACSAAGGYGAMPQSDDAGFGADGSYKVCVRLADAAGNLTYGNSSTITLDKTVPASVSVALTGDVADGFLNAAEVALASNVTTTATAVGHDALKYKVVADTATCSGETGYGASIPKTDDGAFTADGDFKVCVEATDLAGNPAVYGETAALLRDTVIPTFTSLDLINDAANGYLIASERSNTTDLAGNLSASGQTTTQYAVTSSVTACSAAAGYGALPKSDSAAFGGDGVYKICVKLSTPAGNITYGASSTFTLDATPPAFTSISLANDATDGFITLAESASTSALTGAATVSGHDLVEYVLVADGDTCSAAGGWSTTIPKSNSAAFTGDGDWKVCVKASDTAGNPDAFGASATIGRDTVVPAFTGVALGAAAGNGYLNATEYAAAAALVDAATGSGFDTASYKIVAAATTCDDGLTYGALPLSNSGDLGADASYKVCVELTDDAGNPAAYGESSAFTLDKTAPSFVSVPRANTATDGYVNIADRLATSALAGVVSGSGHDTEQFKLVTSGTTCNGALTYGAMPTADSTDFNAGDVAYKVCVELTDAAGNTPAYGGTTAFTLDTVAPAATSVTSSTSNGYYKAADAINVTVTWSEAVTRSGTTGNVLLKLETGTTDRNAVYGSGSGSATWLFSYTVVAGDASSDLDVHASAPHVSFTGDRGAVDVAGNPADTDVSSATSLAANQNIVVDTTAPSAFSITSPSASATVSDNTPTLTWADPGNADLYDVKVDDTSGCGSPTQTYTGVVGLSQALTTLTDGVWYVCVVARDNAGNQTNATNTNLTFTVDTGSWTALSTTGAPLARSRAAAVWADTDAVMVLWGGYDGTVYRADGATYEPSGGTWTTMATGSAPTARADHTATWDGTRVTIWGGFDGSVLNTGGRYTPSGDTWAAVTTTGAPAARRYHSAAWSGTYVVVWGGNGGAVLNTGGRYDPAGNTWTTLTTTGAPSAREGHTGTFTGTYMVVWGGHDGSSVVATGGRYDPSTDAWTSMTTTGAPAARRDHTALWTGSKLLIWGGHDGSSALATGGIYDPGTDTWTAMSTTGAPTARRYHVAAWDDVNLRMFVWGGYDGTSRLGDGAVYDATGNTWVVPETRTTGQPTARESAAAIWDGAEFVVWGGYDGGSYLDDGAYYVAPPP